MAPKLSWSVNAESAGDLQLAVEDGHKTTFWTLKKRTSAAKLISTFLEIAEALDPPESEGPPHPVTEALRDHRWREMEAPFEHQQTEEESRQELLDKVSKLNTKWFDQDNMDMDELPFHGDADDDS